MILGEKAKKDTHDHDDDSFDAFNQSSVLHWWRMIKAKAERKQPIWTLCWVEESSGLTVESPGYHKVSAFFRWTICFRDSSHHASSTSSMFSSSRFIAMIYCVHRCISNIGWGHTLWMASAHAGLDCHTKPTTLNTEHFSASHYTIHTQHCILHTLHLTWHPARCTLHVQSLRIRHQINLCCFS